MRRSTGLNFIFIVISLKTIFSILISIYEEFDDFFTKTLLKQEENVKNS